MFKMILAERSTVLQYFLFILGKQFTCVRVFSIVVFFLLSEACSSDRYFYFPPPLYTIVAKIILACFCNSLLLPTEI